MKWEAPWLSSIYAGWCLWTTSHQDGVFYYTAPYPQAAPNLVCQWRSTCGKKKQPTDLYDLAELCKDWTLSHPNWFGHGVTPGDARPTTCIRLHMDEDTVLDSSLLGQVQFRKKVTPKNVFDGWDTSTWHKKEQMGNGGKR